jgi:hypothetical protein
MLDKFLEWELLELNGMDTLNFSRDCQIAHQGGLIIYVLINNVWKKRHFIRMHKPVPDEEEVLYRI